MGSMTFRLILAALLVLPAVEAVPERVEFLLGAKLKEELER